MIFYMIFKSNKINLSLTCESEFYMLNSCWKFEFDTKAFIPGVAFAYVAMGIKSKDWAKGLRQI